MKRAFKVIGALVVAGLLWSLGESLHFHLRPTAGFEEWTGRVLPEGFLVVCSHSAVTDNILCSSYYCVLQGSAGSFQRLLDGTGFAPSVEAKEGHWQEVQAELVPGLRAEDISEAYAWYPPEGHAQFPLRDRTDTVAYYIVSTL